MVPAMKSLTEHDHVLRWQIVHYDLGGIQKGWRLLLIQSNPFDAESEVVLYRNDPIFPFVRVGLAPVLEMVVLPPIIFYVAGRWCGGAGYVS